MIIEEYTGNDEEWDNYVINKSNSSFYHLYDWRNIFESTIGHKTYYLVAREKGDITGVLPLVLIKSILFETYLISLPYLCEGGICSDSDHIAAELLKSAIDIVHETNATFLLLRQENEIHYSSLKGDDRKVTFILELASDPDPIFKIFDKQVRRRIRKAQQVGFQIDFGRHYYSDFYQIYARRMRDLGSPIQSARFYEDILNTFPNNVDIMAVSLDGRVVGTQFFIKYKDTIHMPFIASEREYFTANINHMIYWEIIKYGCLNGYRFCNFGRSTEGSSSYAFKEQWNAQIKSLPWQYYVKDGRGISGLNTGNSKFSLAIQLWKRMPVWLTKLIGPHLSRNLP